MSESSVGRALLGGTLLSSVSLMVASAVKQAWGQSPPAATDAVRDAFNGLLAFVVPGNDDYSVHQGVTAMSLGAVDAGAAESLIATLDLTTPRVPQFSAVVATLLNGLAQAVNPLASGSFVSPFARLSFAQKAAVFQIMDGNEAYQVFAGVLPGFIAFFVYSEAGAFDPATRSLTGTPLGWKLSSHEGMTDGG